MKKGDNENLAVPLLISLFNSSCFDTLGFQVACSGLILFLYWQLKTVTTPPSILSVYFVQSSKTTRSQT